MRNTDYSQPHPDTIIGPDLLEAIRKYEPQAEQGMELPDPLLQIIYEQKWLRVLMPEGCGGLEMPLPQVVQLFEALAWAGGNTGWCVNLGAGANMFAGYMNETATALIFGQQDTWCAGSGAISGRATPAAGGYRLSGKWKYASGANHATHFTANAFILDDREEIVLKDETAVFRSFIIPANQVINFKNWDAIGLKGTSSNDFEVKDVFVPEDHTFSLARPSSFATGPLYRFPFAAMAVINMTCMMTGIALHFADAYLELSRSKKPGYLDRTLANHPVAEAIYNEARRSLDVARSGMYAELGSVWQVYEFGSVATETQIAALIKKCNEATKASRQLVNNLYPLCGISILSPSAPLNKIWRDAITASQHFLLSPLQYA